MLGLFIDPGRFSTEFALETAERVPDGMGGHVEQWNEVGSVMARIEPISARSRPGADQTLETATDRITLRLRPELRSGMRLRRGARIFSIETVIDPDESGRYLVCRVREEVP